MYRTEDNIDNTETKHNPEKQTTQNPDVKNYKWRLSLDALQLYPYGNSGRQKVKLLYSSSNKRLVSAHAWYAAANSVHSETQRLHWTCFKRL